jgi:hypothetical protein
MITAAAVRALSLAMPEAVQSSHFDVTDFRVRDKIFATIHPGGKKGALLRLDADEVAAVAEAHPRAFERVASNARALLVVFAHVDRAQYEHLLVEAWRGTAPKRLVAALDAEPGPTTPKRAGQKGSPRGGRSRGNPPR